MTGLSASEVGAILADYDFSKRKKISVIEMVFPPGNEPSFGQLVDLEMMLIGGVERAETEYRTLLAETGFNPTRVIPTSSPVCIVESVLA